MFGARGFARLMAWLAVPVLTTCSSPAELRRVDTTRANPPGANPPDPVTSLKIDAPSITQVHDPSLLGLTAYGAKGIIAVVESEVIWSTDDTSIATISTRAVVFTQRRGTVHITARYRGVEATVAMRVKARVRVSADFMQPGGAWFVGTNDSLHLSAYYIDLDGKTIPDLPTVQWSSSDPQLATVGASGTVVGRAFADPNYLIRITAAATDDTTSVFVHIADAFAGLPASVRLAHAVPFAGPLTFTPSQGPPITLKFGEYADIPIRSGMLTVRVDGFPVDNPWGDSTLKSGGFRGLIRASESPALYVIRIADRAGIVLSTTTAHETVPADQARIHIIQGTDLQVLYLRAPQEGASGRPEFCYFDLGDEGFATRAPGDFDLIGMTKYATPASALFATSAPGGRQTTFVLTGTIVANYQIVTFPDP